MRTPNMITWAKGLRTTTDKQADGAMCRQYVDKKEFCCLGWGSTLVPDMPIRWWDETMRPMTEDDMYEVAFGADRQTGLAPREFMEWLGYDLSEWDFDDSTAFDVFIDWPDDVRVRSEFDTISEPLRHDSAAWGEATLLKDTYTAATLNDEGFTFAQIGDLLLHFGMTDAVNPTKIKKS